MKIGIIIQARMGSQRFPGKVMKEIAGKTILEILLTRIRACGLPIVVATTINKMDDILKDFLASLNIQCYRGSEEDVLSRYYKCAARYKFDIIIRLTADNPFVDAALIKECVSGFLRSNDTNLYMTTAWYPLGIKLEIFSFKSLAVAFENAKDSWEREHVTPYIIINQNVKKVYMKHKNDKSHYRLTIDTESDFNLALKLVNDYHADQLTVDEIIQVMDEHSDLAQINAYIHQKST